MEHREVLQVTAKNIEEVINFANLRPGVWVIRNANDTVTTCDSDKFSASYALHCPVDPSSPLLASPVEPEKAESEG